MVGLDGSPESLTALLWALGEARARAIPVHVVLAWQPHSTWSEPGLGSMFPMAYNPGADETDQATVIDSLLDAAIGKGMDLDADSASGPVRITQEAVEGHPAQVLVEIVTDSDLLVVGSHGRGGFVDAMLGSISHHVAPLALPGGCRPRRAACRARVRSVRARSRQLGHGQQDG